MVAPDKRALVAGKFRSFLESRMGEKVPARVEITSEPTDGVSRFAIYYSEVPVENPGLGKVWLPLVMTLCREHADSDCIRDRSDPKKYNGVLGVPLDRLEAYLDRQLSAGELAPPLR